MFCFKVVERTAFLCVSRKAPGKKEKFEDRARGKERKRKRIAGAVSMGGQDRMQSGAELWVGWIHILHVKGLSWYSLST